MSWALPAAIIASTGLKMYGQYQQGKQQKKAYEYNAALYEQQAQTTEVQGAVEVGKLTKEQKVMAGKQEIYFLLFER